MIKFPNFFKGTNFSLLVNLKKQFDFSKLFPYELSEDLKPQLKTKKIILTFSNMHSTINDKNSIKYYEVIIKIHIVINNKNYLFPVITFVDNEVSLIRGYFLGFFKIYDTSIAFNKKSASINNEFLKADLVFQVMQIDRKEKNTLFTHPFVTYKDYDLNSISEKGYFILDIKQIHTIVEKKLKVKGAIFVCGIESKIEEIIYSQNQFILEGTLKI